MFKKEDKEKLHVYLSDNLRNENEFYNKFYNLIYLFLKSLKDIKNVDWDCYENANHLILENGNISSDITYFWLWFKENGVAQVNNIINKKIVDNDYNLDSVEDRLFIMNADIETKNIHNVFQSLASTLTEFEKL